MRLVFLFLFFLCGQLALGQYAEMHNLELGEEDGILDIEYGQGFECSRGFVWMVSNGEGLVRYDGVQAIVYTSNEHGLSSNFVQKVCEAPDSLIWILSALLEGKKVEIDILNPITEEVISFFDFFDTKSLGIEPKTILEFKKNRDGTIWLLLDDQRIFEYDGKELYLWGTSLPKPRSSAIFKVNDAIICMVDSINVVYAAPSGEILDKQFYGSGSRAFVGGDMKYIVTEESVYIKKREKDELAYLFKSHYQKGIEAVDSMLEVEGRRSLHYLFNGVHFFKICAGFIETYDTNFKFCYRFEFNEAQTPIFFDQNGGLWSTKGRGHLACVRPIKKRFNVYNRNEKFKIKWYHQSRGIVKTGQGDLMMAQGGTMVRISPQGDYDFFDPLNGYGSFDFFGIALSRDGQMLWIGEGEDVHKFNLQSNRFEQKYEGLGGLILQPYEDKKGRLWLGGSQGLFWLDQEKEEIVAFTSKEDGPRDCAVFHFYENKAGLWLCTSDGLYLLDDAYQIIAHYHSKAKDKKQLPFDIIAHLSEDTDGWFWLATKGAGLIHWNPKTGAQEQFTKADGLKHDILYAAYCDDFDQVWLPSHHGLMRFDKKTKEVIVYTIEDGIPQAEFNTTSHFKDEAGNFYFGTVRGVIGFHPKDFVQPPKGKPIHITSFFKRNYSDELVETNVQSILRTKEIEISPKDKSFELSFALLDFYNTKRHRYAYKIEGYDQDWHYIKEPIIKMNALPLGKYTLRLKAQSTGNPWQEFDFPITIHVLTPYYWQWWFLFLVFACLSCMVFGMVRFRITAIENQKNALEVIVGERTQEIAKQTEELKALDKVKSRFFANISHELRTPLTLILGPVSGLKTKPISLFSEKEIQKNLNIIERNGKHLLGLIEEILDLSKLDAQKLEVHEKISPLKHYLLRVFSSFESLAELQQIHYRFDYNLPNNLILLLDEDKVERILNNFLSNAFKFTNKGDSIVLKIEEKEANLMLSVEDSGNGISEEDLSHVFERFFQSKSPLLEAQGGTGIGLALCKELAELLGGEVGVSSSLGQGSCFYAQLPKKEATGVLLEELLEEEQEQSEIVEETWHADTKDKTILLVEDNKDMRRFIRSVLETNFNVITAFNGQEGLNCLKKQAQQIDLIISDVMMPQMDGFTMLEEIKANDYWRSLPIIMLTARASKEDRLRALTVGVDDYLIKPFSVEELQARIQNLLRNYEARNLWKQELLFVAKESQQEITKVVEVKTNVEKESIKISEQDLKWLKEVETHVKTNISEETFDVEGLAAQLLISKRQLERKIKKITGLSPAKLVREVRLQTARAFLEQGNLSSVAEVGFAVGLQSPKYFVQIYTKRFGKKPKEYFR